MKSKPKRRPAKVMRWRGWGVIEPADEHEPSFLATYSEELARERARNEGLSLVRVVAQMTEVKP